MNLLSDAVSVNMNPLSMHVRKIKSPVVSLLVKKSSSHMSSTKSAICQL